jgi:formylmethanofuran dehydrogenase subunit C
MTSMWQFEFRNAPTGLPIRAAALDPRAFVDAGELDVANTLVWHGNQQTPAGDLWTIKRTATPMDSSELRFLGDWSSVDEIGKGLGGGTIVVEGNAGLHLGEAMTGGLILVHGDVDDYAGRDMAGGRIHVKGNAGRFVGSATIGAKLGMTGGAILVEGSVGDEVGKKMRRGLIAVGGSCGEFAGASMIAGTILVFGKPGRRPGSGMKRGTIAYLGSGSGNLELLPTFLDDGRFEPLFLNLFLHQLKRWDFPIDPDYANCQFRRWRGDLLELGKGEILAATAG